jgi:uncharacterized repeat protein (TIGR02543 family)
MIQGSENYGFRRLALLCVAAGILGLLFSGCEQPSGGGSRPSDSQYTITFESHGGSVVQPVTANVGTAVSQPADPTWTGYTFVGWFNAETGGVLYSWPHVLTANITMHAQWQDNSQPPPTRYTITFESHGGSEVQPITVNEGTAVSKPADPTWAGYTFMGWFDAETGGVLYSWPHTLTATVTIHAQWTAIAYTVVYNANNGSGTISPSSHTYDIPKNLSVNTFTRTGYIFLSWNTEANGNGKDYADEASILNLSSTGGATVTLYAQWVSAVNINISVWINEDGNILVSSNDVTISKSGSGTNAAGFSAGVTGAYSGVQWYLNGDPISGSQGTAQSITINAADYENKSYYLGVSVSKDGVPYSADIHFRVID